MQNGLEATGKCLSGNSQKQLRQKIIAQGSGVSWDSRPLLHNVLPLVFFHNLFSPWKENETQSFSYHVAFLTSLNLHLRVRKDRLQCSLHSGRGGTDRWLIQVVLYTLHSRPILPWHGECHMNSSPISRDSNSMDKRKA